MLHCSFVLLLLTTCMSFELDFNLDIVVEVEALGDHDTEEMECKMIVSWHMNLNLFLQLWLQRV